MNQLYQVDDLFSLLRRLQSLILLWNDDGTFAPFILKQPISILFRLHGRRPFLLRLGRATFLLPIGVYSYYSFNINVIIFVCVGQSAAL